MIPSWIRWVEVAQFFEASRAHELQDSFADRGIYALIRTHQRERAGIGSTVGYQLLPHRASVVVRVLGEG